MTTHHSLHSNFSRSMSIAAACLVLACAVLFFHAPHKTTAQPALNDPSGLLEIGKASRTGASATTNGVPGEIKIVSYNIRGRAGADLEQSIKAVREDAEIGGATVIGLQEVDRNKERTGHVNTARRVAEALGMHYAWAAPPPERGAQEEETGVALLSPYELTDVVRLLLPHEGPNGRRRAGLGATVRVGAESLRVYSIHAETRLEVAKKIDQWRAAIDDLGKYPQVKRAVVVGDFNTIKGKDKHHTRALFTGAGFTTPVPDDRTTFQRMKFLKLKLDWIWVRGMESTEGGVARKSIGVSDHWPLWAKAKLPTPQK